MQSSKPISIIVLFFVSLFLIFSCTSAPEKKPQPKETFKPGATIEQDTDSPETLEFTQAKEGFLSETLFQVAVSSVSGDPSSRKEEARNVAEQKAFNLLKTSAPSNLSEKGKKELREISKEGKLVDKNISVGNRYFYLYQIQKKELKRLVTSQLE